MPSGFGATRHASPEASRWKERPGETARPASSCQKRAEPEAVLSKMRSESRYEVSPAAHAAERRDDEVVRRRTRRLAEVLPRQAAEHREEGRFVKVEAVRARGRVIETALLRMRQHVRDELVGVVREPALQVLLPCVQRDHRGLEAVRRAIRLLVDAGTFTDRVDGAGVLSQQAARDLGIVGMAARASGVDGDLRRDHPTDAYEGLHFDVPVEDGGDARARLMVRAREIEQSLVILHQVLAALPDTPLAASLPDRLPASTGALGWVEAWRGPCTHWIATDARGDICRVKITDPSFLNWPGLVQQYPGNIIPDFPVINKSFNLSYSGNDR